MQGLSKEKIDAEDPRGMRKVFAETQRTGPGHTGEDVEQKSGGGLTNRILVISFQTKSR